MMQASEDVNISIRDVENAEVKKSASSKRLLSFIVVSLMVIVGTVLVVLNQSSYSASSHVSRRLSSEAREAKMSMEFVERLSSQNGVVKTFVNPKSDIVAKATTVYTVQTIAGNGVNSLPVDTLVATRTPVGTAYDLVFDSSNNMYYTDSQSKTIRLVTASTGVTTTFAGTYGSSGNSGDGGASTSARFTTPFGLSFDNSGNMLMTDTGVHVVRKITWSTKKIAKIAGTGTAAYSGDQLWATASALNAPHSAISDGSGNIYISDFNNCRVRKVLVSNNFLTNYAGTGTCAASADGLSTSASYMFYPSKMTFDTSYAKLYVPEWSSHRIRVITISSGVVSTLAGTTNTAGFSGDGAAATSAKLNNPRKVTVDAAGTGFYITDYSNHCIRYVSSSGVISTYAGICTTSGFNQDILDPNSITLTNPESVALDSNSFVVIADTSNYRIRGVYSKAPTPSPTRSPTSGSSMVVQTLVGNGVNDNPLEEGVATTNPAGTPRDVIFDGSNNLYYADDTSKTVRVVYASSGRSYTYAGAHRIAGSTGDYGPATAARLTSPFGLSWDLNGDMLISDIGTDTVRKVVTGSTTISRVGGTNSGGYSGDALFATASSLNDPYHAVSDDSNNVIIADYNNCRIRKVLTANQYMFNIAGTGTCSSSADGYLALNINIYGPLRVTFDANYKNLYFTEWSSARVRKMNILTNIVTTTAGIINAAGYTGDGGFATSANINGPRSIRFDAVGGLYLSEYYNHAIRYITPEGLIYTVAGTGTAGFNQDGLSPTATKLYNPEGVTVDPNGFVVFCDLTNYRIRGIYSKNPTTVPTLAPTSDGTLYVTTVAGTGANNFPIDEDIATKTAAGNPRDIIFDAKNNMYYSDDKSNTVRVVNATTGITDTFVGVYRQAGNTEGSATSAFFGSPFGLSWDLSGNMLITDTTYHVVKRLKWSTKYVTKIAGVGSSGYSGIAIISTNSALNSPHNAVVDGTGNIYVSDFNNCRVRKVTPNNYMYDFAGAGSCAASDDGLLALNINLYYVAKITFSPSYTYLYIPEWSSARIRRVTMATNVVTTVTGVINAGGYTGDGGLAIGSKIGNPRKVTVDAQGGIYISDWSNHVIRYISPQGIISTYAGTGTAGFNQDGIDPTLTKLYNPESCAFDRNGNMMIADLSNYRIRGIFTKFPTFLPTRSPTVQNRKYTVRTIAGTGANGYPIDEQNALMVPAGTPRDVVFDLNNNLYYSDDSTNTVRVVYASSGLTYTFAGTYRTSGNTGDRDVATSARLAYPYGLSFDPMCNNLLVTDISNHVVRVISMSTQVISLVAGSGAAGYSGDSLGSTISALSAPHSAIYDGGGSGVNGYIYISDFNNCRIRVVKGTVMYNFAGTGTCGNSDDGLLALNSNLYSPSKGTFDKSFNFYVFPEYNSHRVRTITMSTMVMNTLAGLVGAAALAGDGGLAVSANLYYPRKVVADIYGGFYIADTSNHAVRYVNKEGLIFSFIGGVGAGFNQDYLSSTQTKLSSPESVTLDMKAYVVVADTGNYRIRGAYTLAPTSAPTRFPTKASVIYTVDTVIGTGSNALPVDGLGALATPAGTPYDMAFDASDNIYYADGTSKCVRVVYAATGKNYNFAGTNSVAGTSGDGGAATAAKFTVPYGVRFDINGDLLIVDNGAPAIRKVTMATGIITRIAGTFAAGFTGDAFAATSSAINNPHEAISDGNGNIYISDANNNRVRRVLNADQKMYTFAGTGAASSGADGYQALSTPMYTPVRIAFDRSFSNLYIPEWYSHRIRKVNMNTGICSTVVGGYGAGFTADGGLAVNSATTNPRNLVFDTFGGFYFVDYGNYVIRYVTSEGIISTFVGIQGSNGYNQDGIAALATKINAVDAVALDSKGTLHFVDYNNYRIRRVTVSSAYTAWPTSVPTVSPSA